MSTDARSRSLETCPPNGSARVWSSWILRTAAALISRRARFPREWCWCWAITAAPARTGATSAWCPSRRSTARRWACTGGAGRGRCGSRCRAADSRPPPSVVQQLAAGQELPGAGDVQDVHRLLGLRQRWIRLGKSCDTQGGIVEELGAAGTQDVGALDRAVAADRHADHQFARQLPAACLVGVVEVAHALHPVHPVAQVAG